MRRLLARFLVLYFTAYCGFVVLSNMAEVPFSRAHYEAVVWLGRALFGMPSLSSAPNGSGDTSTEFGMILLLLALALLGAIVWTALQRSRGVEAGLGAMRVVARYSVAATMVGYGIAKVLPLQFGTLYPLRLLQPVGEMSPMGMLWTFMGASRAYQIFGGAAEMLGGVLLLSRRTTLAGALVSLAVVTNVFALNLFYDVPVKLLSLHLVILCGVLIAPDGKRLIDFFWFHRPPAQVDLTWRSRGKRLDQLRLAGKGLALLVTFGLPLLAVLGSPERPSQYVRELDGIWIVDSFRRNGEVAETDRWTRLHIATWSGQTYVYRRIELETRYRLDLDKGSLRLVRLTRDDKSLGAYLFRWEKLDGDRLLLEGTIEGETVRVVARRVDTSKMLLLSRGFHWISEAPFNR